MNYLHVFSRVIRLSHLALVSVSMIYALKSNMLECGIIIHLFQVSTIGSKERNTKRKSMLKFYFSDW